MLLEASCQPWYVLYFAEEPLDDIAHGVDLRRTVYDHLLGLSQGFYAHTRTGEVLSRLTTDTTLIQTVVGS